MPKIKVVYNACYGGFSLSDAAVRRAKELAPGDKRWQSVNNGKGWHLSEIGIPRHDPVLVQVVEELGDDASGTASILLIEEVEGLYLIDEYDGLEAVMTPSDYKWTDPTDPTDS